MDLRPKEKKKEWGKSKKKKKKRRFQRLDIFLSKTLRFHSQNHKTNKNKRKKQKNKSKSMSISSPNHQIQSLSHTYEDNGYIIVFLKILSNLVI